LYRVASKKGLFDLTCLFMKMVGEALEDWKMRGIVPADNGPVGKELVRIDNFLLCLDEPDL